MKIIIYRSRFPWIRQRYSFKVIARNGETIARSESYYNLKDCEDTAALLKLGASRCHIVHDFDRDEDRR